MPLGSLDSQDPAAFWDFVERRGRYLEQEQAQRAKAEVGATQGDIREAARKKGLLIY